MTIYIFELVLLFAVLVNGLYYILFSRVTFYKNDITSEKDTDTPISIIVCAKNEEENLKKLVPLLLEQDHKNLEIILVNDSSTDNTLDVIDHFIEIDSRVKKVDVIQNEQFWGNKKYALTLGIKKATNEHLLFIEADCRPNSKFWARSISSKFDSQKSIVLGYGGYLKKKNSLLNAIIRYDTVLIAMQYMSAAIRGNAYMGVGRNLAYTSTQFYESSGFMSHMKILGGDDDLFVNQSRTKNNVAISTSESSFTYSVPKDSWNQWFAQKRRHYHVANHYKFSDKCFLFGFFLSQIFWLITAIIALIYGDWVIAGAIISIRYLLFYWIMYRGLLRFRESDLTPLIPLLELVLLIQQLRLGMLNLFRKPQRW